MSNHSELFVTNIYFVITGQPHLFSFNPLLIVLVSRSDSSRFAASPLTRSDSVGSRDVNNSSLSVALASRSDSYHSQRLS